jgi:DNA-binding MarR family transcriptional regulator
MSGGGEPVGDWGVERPTLPMAVAAQTGVVLSKAAQFVQELWDCALAPLGMKTRHHSVLAVLAHGGALSQQAVGRMLHLDAATVVRVVDDLERLGLVERRRNAASRRQYDLTLTEAGWQMVVNARAAIAAAEAAAFAPLSEQQRADLHALLSLLFAPA